MRMLIGIVLGIALTIGTAWIVDSQRAATPGGPEQLVNWTQVDQSWAALRENVAAQWRRVTG